MGILNGKPIAEEALHFAAQLWCRPENEKRQMDVVFGQSIADAIEPLLVERDNWIEESRRHLKNAEHWRQRAEG